MPLFLCYPLGSGDQAVPPERSSSNEYDEVLNEKRRKVEKKLPSDKKELARALKRDMKHYEATGNRSDALELLRKALSGIPPTSVEAEVGENIVISNLVWKVIQAELEQFDS